MSRKFYARTCIWKVIFQAFTFHHFLFIIPHLNFLVCDQLKETNIVGFLREGAEPWSKRYGRLLCSFPNSGPGVPAGNIQSLVTLILWEVRDLGQPNGLVLPLRWSSWLWPRVKLSGSWGVFSLALMEPIIFRLSFSTLFPVIFWVLLQLGLSKPCLSVFDTAGDLNLWSSVLWSRST